MLSLPIDDQTEVCQWRVEVTFRLVTTIALGYVRLLLWVEVDFAWVFDPMSFTVTSNFSSVEVGVSLVNSRLRVIGEYCTVLFVLFTGRMWKLKSCLGWLKIWLSGLNG